MCCGLVDRSLDCEPQGLNITAALNFGQDINLYICNTQHRCSKWVPGRIHSLNALSAMVAGAIAGVHVLLSKFLWENLKTFHSIVIWHFKYLH